MTEPTQTPADEPYDDGTPASPEQIAALWQQLQEFSEQIERDRKRFRDNEVARLTALRDAEPDEATKAEIQHALDQVIAGDEGPDQPVPSTP
ncbi:MAG TPA: hypothetical protein PKM36_11840 [Propionibacteriaceae bacterium]|nr:hypothetical protein [Propionibacteriaceae bacterium]